MIHDLIHFFSNTVFPQILEMTVVASIVILAVIIVRFFIRKAPKIFSYLLWSIVLFRLLCPISFSTNMSMLNLKLFSTPMVQVHEIQNVSARSEITDNIQPVAVPKPSVTNDIPATKTETTTVEKTIDNSHPITATSVATAIWVAGMLLLFITNLVSFLKLKLKAAACIKVRDNIYIADEIDTPFCLGFLQPKIYLPSNLLEREMEYIIIHEQTHIRRMDHIIKMLAFVALIIHWFNPLVWVAFILACKDIEMSCDETVLRKMKGDIRQEYCMSILQLATRKRISLVSPLSFADGDPKHRIINVMNYKKPGKAIIVLSILICIIAGVVLSSNAKPKANANTDTTTNADAIADSNADSISDSNDDSIEDNTANTIVQVTTNNTVNADSLQEITDERIIKEYLHGLTLPTDMDISNVEYYLCGDTLEIHFKYGEYTSLIARIAEADSYKDISDADYPWTFETDELTVLDCPTHTTSYFSDTESVMLITWFEAAQGVNVSLEAMGQNLDGFDIFTVAERMLPQNNATVTSTESSYKSILDYTYTIVSGTNIDIAADDDTIGLIESSAGDASEALANIGYCTTDINADGSPELLIIDNRDGDNRILDIYCLDETGNPIFLVGGWMRNKYYLTDDNCIVNIGSGGAAYTVYMTYRLSGISNSLIPIESYYTDYKDDASEQLGWFHSTTGSLEKADSEWLGDAYDDALTAKIKSKHANHKALDLIYFKDYQK